MYSTTIFFRRFKRDGLCHIVDVLAILRRHTIMLTCPCNVYPLEHHYYTTKQGYTGFFHILLQNIACGYSLEPPHRGGSNMYPQSMFWSKKKKKNINFFLMKFSIIRAEKNLYILHGQVFVMKTYNDSLMYNVILCLTLIPYYSVKFLLQG